MSQSSITSISSPSKAIGSLVSPLSKPATPTSTPTTIPPSPGSFRHPQFTQIIERQSASSLTSRRIQNVGVNAVVLVATFAFRKIIYGLITTVFAIVSIPPTVLDASTVVAIGQALLCVNILVSLRPVIPYVARKDEVSDIPLTPSQRALLGLSPSAHTSSAGYVTPPRYRRDGGTQAVASPQSSPLAFSATARSISANYSGSPLSTSRYTLGFSPSPQQTKVSSVRPYRQRSGSPFAASPNPSPSQRPARMNDFQDSTFTTVHGRASFGASTSSLNLGLGRSQSLRDRTSGLDTAASVPATPSPSGPKRQPGVNYKWLYDKGAGVTRNEGTGI